MREIVLCRYMKKETTLDTLARLIATGFEEQDRKFDILTREVRAINRRIDKTVRPELDDHARRIKDLEIAAA